MGAGVQGYEAMEAAQAEGLVTVGGECPTVGIAGGYSQGGGHSALSTSFGLGADQTLSWEVVTAQGKLIIASRFENPDIYWALSGGGGGTYGVVLSLTSKAHPDNIIGGATLTFLSSSTTIDKFYEGVTAFHVSLPAIIDAGFMVVYFLTNTAFEIFALTGYGKTLTEVKTILADFLSALNALNITYTVSYSQSANYVDHYNTYLGPLPFGAITVGVAQYGDRLIPRSSLENNLTAFITALRNITESGCAYSGVALNVSSPAITSGVSNAVLPAWREALIHALLRTPWNFTAPWSEMIAWQDRMTYEFVPQLEAVTPGSGAYINEADFRQPNWQHDFFGANYENLLEIKNKWDPYHLFYATKAVGSEFWTVAEDGRMCKTSE
jgi:FAD/FMN-containing dehydrogenase